LGRLHAAIDACYEALAIAPADPDIHLALAELYLDQGWRALAADKLVLLGRLVQLTGDSATRARLCDLAGTRFADDPRLAAICA
jgi:thioredoxin-like negative regulator of GroEL